MKHIPTKLVLLFLFPISVWAQANRPPVVDAGEPSIIVLESSVTLRGTITDPDGATDIVRIEWKQKSGPSQATLTNANQLQVTLSGLQNGVYVFTFTAADRQTAVSDDIRVEVREVPEVPGNEIALLPKKFFSPNGDGANDTWDIQNIGLFPTYTVWVMDANGRKIFEKSGFTSDVVWDGASGWQGAYYYVVKDGAMKEVQTGTFSLLW